MGVDDVQAYDDVCVVVVLVAIEDRALATVRVTHTTPRCSCCAFCPKCKSSTNLSLSPLVLQVFSSCGHSARTSKASGFDILISNRFNCSLLLPIARKRKETSVMLITTSFALVHYTIFAFALHVTHPRKKCGRGMRAVPFHFPTRERSREFHNS